MSDPVETLATQLRGHVRRVVLPIYRRLADWAPAPPAGQAISCSNGCGACCWQTFPVPLIDAIAIVDDLRTRGATRHLAAILARAADREQQLHIDYGSRGYFARREPCVLFQREGDGRARSEDAPEDYRGGCSVYAVRPVVCRTYFVTSPVERCRPGNERGRVVFGMTPLNEEIRATLLEKLGEEWLLLPLPLPVGLRWAEILLSGGQLDAADATFWQERVRRAEEMRGRVFAEAWSGPAMLAGRRGVP